MPPASCAWHTLSVIHGRGHASLPETHRRFRSIEELAILFCEVRFRSGHLEGHTKTRTVPDVDEAFFDDRIWQAFDNVVPPLGLAEWVLEGDVVLGQRGGQMNVGGKADQAVEDAVRSD